MTRTQSKRFTCDLDERLYVDPKTLKPKQIQAAQKRAAYDSFQRAVAVLPEDTRPKIMPQTVQGALDLIATHFTSPETALMVNKNGYLKAAFKMAPNRLKQKVLDAQVQAQVKLQTQALVASIQKARGLTAQP